ncbi:hypothetical protein D3C86_1837380 [compost metagenome]
MPSTIFPYKGGITAPPEIAITNNAAPVLVNFPNPFRVKGQTAGQTKAFAIPNAATNKTEVNPVENTIQKDNIIPKTALTFRARACVIYFGIKNAPKA